TDAGWTVRLQPSKLRLFVDGSVEQLPNLVETLELPRRQPFYLAFHESIEQQLRSWGAKGCQGWQEIEIKAGIPPDWILAKVERAMADDGLRSVDDRFSFPDRPTMRFSGGIPGARRDTFLSFAAPDVVLAGAIPGDTITCNGSQLSETLGNPDSFSLPTILSEDARILIEVHRGGNTIKRRSLYLVSGTPWQFDTALAVTDGYGRCLLDGESGIAGATTPLVANPSLPFDPLRTPGLQSGDTRVYLVGKAPGHITEWPAEPPPITWQPIWAIPIHRRGKALFCGTSIDEAAPGTRPVENRSNYELWRKVLWQWRRRIEQPKNPALKDLWIQYQKVARDA
ncbi:MAG: hypothetical protein ACYCOU_06670, partial [Sulfobacillus sp.]